MSLCIQYFLINNVYLIFYVNIWTPRGETILDDINVITPGDYAVLSIRKESKLSSLTDETIVLVITGNKISGSQLFEDYKAEVFNSIKFQGNSNIFGGNQLSNDLQVEQNLNSTGK